MTTVTLQAIVDRARPFLFDDTKDRWPDSELLQHVVWGLHHLRMHRSDFFIGQLTLDIEALTLNSTFPLQNDVIPKFEDLIIARSLFKDNEVQMQQRAAPFFQLSGAQ